MASEPNEADRKEQLDEEAAKACLREYIFYHREVADVHFVPHRIPADVATKFICDEVEVDAPAEHIGNACDVARFYLLKDCLDHFGGFLSRSTREREEVYASLESVDILGDLGEEGEHRLAGEHWGKFAKHQKVEQLTERMIRSFFHLGPKASPKPLEDQLNTLIKKCADEKTETAASRQHHLGHAQADLARAAEAKRQKDKLLAMAQSKPRAYGIARVYLGLTNYSTFGREWAGYALLAEAERSSPKNVLDGMRQALGEFERTRFGDDDLELVAEFREDARARGYQTIVYFGGSLEEEEERFMQKDPAPPANMYTPS